MKALAIITARGGSKRIPRKNIRPFLGIPVIGYSIKSALESAMFEEVMVSTDDPEIADVARSCGASVPFMRSSSTADDFSTTADVLTEVLNQYRGLKREFAYTCCLYPTAPFITPALLEDAMTMMVTKDADSVFPVAKHPHSLFRSLKIESGKVSMAFPEYETVRSQDLGDTFYDCGQFYLLNTQRFLQSGRIYTSNSYPVVVSEMNAQDIDNETDWKLAELKYALIHGKS